VFTKALVLLGAAVSVILALRFNEEHRIARFEFPVLVLLASTGMMLMISANDLIALYLGLELQSLALYVVASFDRDSVRSTEAGLKYFVLGALASVGLPGTSGFVGEFLVLLGTFRVSTSAAVLAATALFLGPMYMLYLYRRIIFGTITRDEVRAMLDLNPREKAIFAPLLVLVVWMGVYPEPFLAPIRPTVEALVARVASIQHQARASAPDKPLPAAAGINLSSNLASTERDAALADTRDTERQR
jgi:NADH:ubiquinone oxidoreductase subunit 4 (subunit M)